MTFDSFLARPLITWMSTVLRRPPSPSNNAFGEMLESLAKDRGQRLKDFAKDIGISDRTLRRYRRGKGEIDDAQMAILTTISGKSRIEIEALRRAPTATTVAATSSLTQTNNIVLNEGGPPRNKVDTNLGQIGSPDKDGTYLIGREEEPLVSEIPLQNSDIATFIRKSNVSNIKRISIICLTGQSTINDILLEVEKLNQPLALSIRILLRSPYSSDYRRNINYQETVKALNRFRSHFPGITFEIRYYLSSLPLHSVVCEHTDGSLSGWLSSYTWERKDKRDGWGGSGIFATAFSSDNVLERTNLSWFNHLWGHGKIHTILFDFDDTIFLTTDFQVNAWVDAMKFGIAAGLLAGENINSPFAGAVGSEDAMRKLIEKTFLDEQEEEKISRKIFRNVSPEKYKIIMKRRTELRENMTLMHAAPIPGIATDIEQLANNYQLAIVSSTSEEMIDSILSKHNLNKFSYIIGRNAQRYSWVHVENKSQHFIRMSNMLGVPLDRMIFVGDSNADFRSATQLGLHFIENKYNAGRYGRDTLIDEKVGRSKYAISKSSKPGELLSLVQTIESELKT